MSRHVRIALLVVITVTLLLVVALPGMAKKSETYPCQIDGLVLHNDGEFYRMAIEGELEAYWEDGVLYNFCRGIIPWGEPLEVGNMARYATFEETCDYFGGAVTCTKNLLSTTPEQWGGDVSIYDPDTDTVLTATDGYFTAHRVTGKFLFYKEYTPPVQP